MTKTTRTRAELDKHKVDERKRSILRAAIVVAEKRGGWSKMTREAVAREAGCADAAVSVYFGTMTEFKRTVMRHAIGLKNLSILAQGLAAGDKHAEKADADLKRQAIDTLVV